jgi:hypothetical protein
MSLEAVSRKRTAVRLESWTVRCPRCRSTCSDRDFLCENCHKGRIKWSRAREGRAFFCDDCDHSHFLVGVKCPNCPVFIDKKYVRARTRLEYYGEFIALTTLLIVLVAVSALLVRHWLYWTSLPSP